MKAKEAIPMMGKVVTVTAELYREARQSADSEKREWKKGPLVTPRVGWVIGWRTLQNGIYSPGSGHSCFGPYGEDDYEDSYLNVTGTTPCLLVVYWPTMNPVKVPMDAFKEGGEPKAPGLPWSQRDKDEMRRIMSDTPRDEKGRWLK